MAEGNDSCVVGHVSSSIPINHFRGKWQADSNFWRLRLAARTGAKIYTSYRAPVSYDRVPARDGKRIRVGSL